MLSILCEDIFTQIDSYMDKNRTLFKYFYLVAFCRAVHVLHYSTCEFWGKPRIYAQIISGQGLELIALYISRTLQLFFDTVRDI